MKINELVVNGSIILDLKATNKEDVILEMSSSLKEKNSISNLEDFVGDIWKREKQFSTGFGDGIAIPHAKSEFVKTPSIVFAKSKKGVDFDSLDKKPSFLFFMIAAPSGEESLHLTAIAKLSRKLMKEDFRKKLLSVTSQEEVIEIFKEME